MDSDRLSLMQSRLIERSVPYREKLGRHRSQTTTILYGSEYPLHKRDEGWPLQVLLPKSNL